MKEIWKFVNKKKYNTRFYKVSNKGRVKSLARKVRMVDGRTYTVMELFCHRKIEEGIDKCV